MNPIATRIKRSLACALLVATTLGLGAGADDDFYPWRHHAAPFDFKFSNMIDSHQQTMILPTGDLQGFLYVRPTGEVTPEGLPVAERAWCSEPGCAVGWILKGVPIEATLVHKGPRVWLIDENDLPLETGYGHFQWVGSPRSAGELVVGQTYFGFLMKRVAPQPFYWLGNTSSGRHGGRIVPEGVDPHTNIVLSWDGDRGTGCCGHDDGSCSHDDDGGCSGDDGGCTHDDGGCSGDDGGSHDDGGCGGGDDGGHDGGGGS